VVVSVRRMPALMDVRLCFHQAPDSDVFQGFIRVHMNLHKPISMAIAPPRAHDVTASGRGVSDDVSAETEPFYLPANTSKVIHITRSVYNVCCMTSRLRRRQMRHTLYAILFYAFFGDLPLKAFRFPAVRVSMIIY